MFDIVPVKDKNEALNRKYKKRSLTDNLFYHVIHKRAVRLTSDSKLKNIANNIVNERAEKGLKNIFLELEF